MKKFALKCGLITIAALVMFGLLVKTPVAYAQTADANEIKYGDTVKDNLTNSKNTFTYTFTGKAKDVVVIRYGGDEAVDYDKRLNDPQMTVTDSTGKVLIDSTKLFMISDITVGFTLPTAGTYTITATRKDGESGTAVGAFSLMLVNPVTLQTDKDLSDKTTSKLTKYYVIVAPKAAFNLIYVKNTGDFSPSIEIQSIDEGGALTTAADLSGSKLQAGLLAIDPAENTNYLVTVGPGILEFGTGNVNYTLRLTDVKSSN